MVNPPTPKTPTREARLGAKLRENLHRRKAQSRDVARTVAESSGDPLPKPPSKV